MASIVLGEIWPTLSGGKSSKPNAASLAKLLKVKQFCRLDSVKQPCNDYRLKTYDDREIEAAATGGPSSPSEMSGYGSNVYGPQAEK